MGDVIYEQPLDIQMHTQNILAWRHLPWTWPNDKFPFLRQIKYQKKILSPIVRPLFANLCSKNGIFLIEEKVLVPNVLRAHSHLSNTHPNVKRNLSNLFFLMLRRDRRGGARSCFFSLSLMQMERGTFSGIVRAKNERSRYFNRPFFWWQQHSEYRFDTLMLPPSHPHASGWLVNEMEMGFYSKFKRKWKLTFYVTFPDIGYLFLM